MAASSITPAQKALAAATAALLAALTVWVSAGKPKYTPHSSAVDTLAAVHQWQCPDSLPNALVVDYYRIADMRVAGDTLFYPTSKNAPVVLCGPSAMIRQIVAHPEAGHGSAAVVNAPDSTMTAYVVPSLTVQGGHIIAPHGDAARGLDTLVKRMLALSGVSIDSAGQYMAIAERADSGRMWATPGAGVPVWVRYQPARGTRERTSLVENAGACWGGDPWIECQANGGTRPARTPTSWLKEWSDTVSDLSRSSVYRLAVVIPIAGVMSVPSSTY
jgi:hypothetical protein